MRVRVHDEPRRLPLHLRPHIDGLGFFHVVVDDGGYLTSAIATTDKQAAELVYERLREERHRAHYGGLLAPGGPPERHKRRLALRTDDERLSARAKVYFDEDEEEHLLCIRLFIDGFGAVQLMLTDRGRMLAFITGRTDSDAYDRIRGELARKGVELEVKLRRVGIAVERQSRGCDEPRLELRAWAAKAPSRLEGEGFEPSVRRKTHNGFRDRPVQPLRHPSGTDNCRCSGGAWAWVAAQTGSGSAAPERSAGCAPERMDRADFSTRPKPQLSGPLRTDERADAQAGLSERLAFT